MSRRWCAFAPASVVPRRSDLAVLVIGASVLFVPREASAVRFGLGIATDLTPLVFDPAFDDGNGAFRWGFRPVLEVEANHYLSFGAYAPFTIFRGEESGAASSGAESVFGGTI